MEYKNITSTTEILYTPPEAFHPYPNDKLRLQPYTGEQREELKKSIITNGIIEPIIAYQPEDTLTIISGHNRVSICLELNLPVPYRLLTNITQEEADLICIDSNLYTRQTNALSISKLAYILAARNEILKSQGKRTDLTLDQIEPKLNTSKQLSETYKLSPASVKRYIRLTKLNKGLLDLIDNKQLPFNVGVQLSYLKSKEQKLILDFIKQGYKISLKQAQQIKELYFENETLTSQEIKNLLEYKQLQQTSTKFTIDDFKEYIPEDNLSDVKDIIVEALKMYFSK